jgi:RNA polymerase sigma-70 factor (ECF subfamily)
MNTDELYQTFFDDVLRYLKHYITDAQAEELAQEVFVKADKGLDTFRGEASAKTWVFRIATNTLRDFLRSKSYRYDNITKHISEQELEKCPCESNEEVSTEQAIIRKEMNDCIMEYILRLPDNYSSVLVLSDIEGHSNREVAEVLELSLDTVKIRLHRARARLKEELSEACILSYNSDNELVCDRRQ